MKLKKQSIILALSLVIMSSLSLSAFATTPTSRNNIFHSSFFQSQNNTLNLIVNDMYENNTGLVLDVYLFNSTAQNFREISNLNLELYDNNGRIFGKKEFVSLPINGGLSSFQGKRTELIFDRNTYNLSNDNLSNITWKFTYNYKY